MSEGRERGELDRLVKKKPGWLIRWGMTLLFAVMALIFWATKNILAP
ncbi:MAG: hypothetical protein JW836_09655 [Deltaproteobacteria bacterium]|nr:hypothetical protein [Deltaproteobacteria bacterium]